MSDALRVVGAVIRHEGKILACRRRPEKAEGGKWEFPGGKIEAGESPQYALRRELAEELGVANIQILELVERATTESDGRRIDLACYHVKIDTPPTSSTDHDSLLWCDQSELRNRDWAAADLPILDTLDLQVQAPVSTGGTSND